MTPEDLESQGPLRYIGIDRRGRGVAGTLGPRQSLAAHVEELFEKGWQRLEVTDSSGVVAGIGPHPDTGRRTWWAEA